MRKVGVFNFVTLDGYFEGPHRDISWHKHDADGTAYAAEGLKSGSTLLFGRVTYELMASYWPTPLAINWTNGGAAVVMRVQAEHDAVAPREMAVHPFDLVRIDIGRGQFHGGRQIHLG